MYFGRKVLSDDDAKLLQWNFHEKKDFEGYKGPKTLVFSIFSSLNNFQTESFKHYETS
jgi:hypothetical protein